MDYIEDFLDFLSIPSISALPEHKTDIVKAAQWLKRRMINANLDDVRVIETNGHPVVFGQKASQIQGCSSTPTVLIYGHYDVQPVDPINEWVSPPFEPEIRDGKVFARGSADDKGGIFPAILAAEDLIKQNALPVNLKFLFEGEEEIGSPGLKQILSENKSLFQSDIVLSVDGGMFSTDIPSITTGSRGLAAIEIVVSGPQTDVHSGGQGGVIQNPIHALAQILTELKDEQGRILVDGFFDDVVEVSESELTQFKQVPFDDEEHKDRLKIPELFGEPEYSSIERMWIRPTLDANGIWGGFQGDGIKTIIPSKAGCKITCRLVPNQDPEVVSELLKRYIQNHVPKGVTVDVTTFPGNSHPYVIPRDHSVLPVLSEVLEELFGCKPVNVRSGGTLPIAPIFLNVLGSYLFFFAMSGPDSNAHGPNEFIRIKDVDKLRRGLKMFLNRYARTFEKN